MKYIISEMQLKWSLEGNLYPSISILEHKKYEK